MKVWAWRHRWRLAITASLALYVLGMVALAHVMAEATVRHYGPWTCWTIAAFLAAFPASFPAFIVGIAEDDRDRR